MVCVYLNDGNKRHILKLLIIHIAYFLGSQRHRKCGRHFLALWQYQFCWIVIHRVFRSGDEGQK